MIDDLIKWNSRWRLNSRVVSCRVCLAGQEEADRGAVFLHSKGCSCEYEKSDPWADLDKACGQAADWNPQVATGAPSYHARYGAR